MEMTGLRAIVLLVGIAAGLSPTSHDEWDIGGIAEGSDVVLDLSTGTDESSEPGKGDYAQGSPGTFSSSPSDVAVIRDATDSFCISDNQRALCIPDPGEPTEEEEESEEPTIIDVVGAAEAQIERDIARLGVEPARINHQPPGGEVLVNIDTIFYTEADVQYLSTTVLGHAVLIEVTPVWFEWGFGDGEGLGTADPGAPYPAHTVAHQYQAAGDNFVSLETTWNARFRVEGVSNWIPVSGQPVTRDEVGPIRSVTKTNRLVALD